MKLYGFGDLIVKNDLLEKEVTENGTIVYHANVINSYKKHIRDILETKEDLKITINPYENLIVSDMFGVDKVFLSITDDYVRIEGQSEDDVEEFVTKYDLQQLFKKTTDGNKEKFLKEYFIRKEKGMTFEDLRLVSHHSLESLISDMNIDLQEYEKMRIAQQVSRKTNYSSKMQPLVRKIVPWDKVGNCIIQGSVIMEYKMQSDIIGKEISLFAINFFPYYYFKVIEYIWSKTNPTLWTYGLRKYDFDSFSVFENSIDENLYFLVYSFPDLVKFFDEVLGLKVFKANTKNSEKKLKALHILYTENYAKYYDIIYEDLNSMNFKDFGVKNAQIASIVEYEEDGITQYYNDNYSEENEFAKVPKEKERYSFLDGKISRKTLYATKLKSFDGLKLRRKRSLYKLHKDILGFQLNTLKFIPKDFSNVH